MSPGGLSYAAVLPMACTILGPGLVGSYLGIAAGARTYIPGPSGHPAALRARLPSGPATWQPQRVAVPTGPVLAATRCDVALRADLGTDVLAAQNGLGQTHAVAVCFFAVDLDPKGTVVAHGLTPRLVLTTPSPRWQPVLTAWRRAGLIVDEVADLRPAQWEKAILNATVGPLCLATGLRMAGVWAHAPWRELTMAATHEGVAIAHAAGIAVNRDLPERAAAFFAAVGAHRPSVLKHPGELPAILLPLLTAARTHGVQAPALERIATLVEQTQAVATAP